MKDTDTTTWPEKFANLYLNFQKNDTAVDKLFFFLIFFSFYHNKIHPATNYNAIKNKIKQDNAGHLFYFILFFNKQNKNTHTHIHTKKKDKKRKRDEITCSRPPSLFMLNRVSINHMINGMPFL